MKGEVLILTNERDLSADFVVNLLTRRGIPVVRLNTERATSWNAQVVPGQRWELIGDSRTASSDSAVGVWWRRPEAPERPPGVSEEAWIAASRQWRTLFESFAEVSGQNWISKPAAIERAESKARQLKLASEVGLAVPATLWTNSKEAAEEFFRIQEDRAIAKSVSTAYWEHDGVSNFVFAHSLLTSQLPSPTAIAMCPVALQDEIAPKRDVRLTVVGSKTFAARCESAPSGDWRLAREPKWVATDVPRQIRDACVDLVRRLDIQFAGIDLLEDREGNHWFVEANPNGEFGWLQAGAGLPIAEAISDLLTRR